MIKNKSLFLVLFVLLMSSCASIFLPKKQTVTVNTKDKDATVYVNNEEIGSGANFKAKVKKDGPQQVVIQSPNGRTTYRILYPHKHPGAWHAYRIIDLACFPIGLYGFMLDGFIIKSRNYSSINNFQLDPLKYRSESEKRINVEKIQMEIKDIDKDITSYSIPHTEDLIPAMEKIEAKVDSRNLKKEMKKNEKSNQPKKKLEESNEIVYDDTKFSEDIYKTLKKTGYVDTVNLIFNDGNNTLSIRGKIKKAKIFSVSRYASSSNYYSEPGKINYGEYYKSKLYITWYIQNNYDEILDSIDIKAYSGEHIHADVKKDISKMFSDAVNSSYFQLLNNSQFKKHIKMDTNYAVNYPLLALKAPTNQITTLQDASKACVIIKRKDKGHGSGFAISNDGYIITNFHVIAGKDINKLEECKVISPSGEELDVKVVRYNRAKDIALLKVEKPFEKAFKLSSQKGFSTMQEVYTIGAPKSIELGQSVSTGLISNERNANQNNLIQLNMAVNSGNSGGPLFEKTGNLHGVISSKLYGIGVEGISFAIPTYKLESYLNLKVE